MYRYNAVHMPSTCVLSTCIAHDYVHLLLVYYNHMHACASIVLAWYKPISILHHAGSSALSQFSNIHAQNYTYSTLHLRVYMNTHTQTQATHARITAHHAVHAEQKGGDTEPLCQPQPVAGYVQDIIVMGCTKSVPTTVHVHHLGEWGGRRNS